MNNKRLEEIKQRLDELKEERDRLNAELQEEQEAEKEILAKEVNDAYEAYIKAYKVYKQLSSNYIKKYNNLRVSYTEEY